MQRFRLTIFLLILAELFSFCAFLHPAFNKICFFTIIFLALILSLEKLEYGIYLLLAELFIGSFGYLFFYETGGVKLSLRIGLFLAIFSVWSAKLFTDKKKLSGFFEKCRNNKFIKWHLLLFVFLIFGVINGLLRKNSFSDVFFDANSFVYFALIFPLTDTIRNELQIKQIFSLLLAASVVIAAKSLFLLFIFSHKMHYAMEYLYTWMRDFRLGELTAMQGGFYRIFSQSHIYVLIALFFIGVMIFFNDYDNDLNSVRMQNAKCKLQNDNVKFKNFFHNFALYILFLTVIILGMSRSFWVGGLAALIALYSWLIFVFYKSRKLRCQEIESRTPPKPACAGRRSAGLTQLELCTPSKEEYWPPYLKFLAKFTGALILGFIISIILIFLIVKFPYPGETAYFSTDLFKDRALTINDEAGSSRWNLLPVLVKKIMESPILGSGFGTAVTYKSGDPRVLSSNPAGEYTTYAFEWGYLDIILKIGLLGMFAYLWIVCIIFKEGWKRLRVAETERCFVSVMGLMSGLIVILATSVFSPYMNHPLGIGYIMLAAVAIPIL